MYASSECCGLLAGLGHAPFDDGARRREQAVHETRKVLEFLRWTTLRHDLFDMMKHGQHTASVRIQIHLYVHQSRAGDFTAPARELHLACWSARTSPAWGADRILDNMQRSGSALNEAPQLTPRCRAYHR